MDEALVGLERALLLAEAEGYVRIFLDEAEPMAKLLRRAVSQGIVPRYGKRLLAAFRGPPGQVSLSPGRFWMGQPVPRSDLQPSFPLEGLSERELEVLQLIAAGLSNQRIADELMIALGTVKKHTSNIYSKLNVDKRTQAVARARELHLL